MFQLHQLDQLNGILTRLFKQECQMIVMRYETYRWVQGFLELFLENLTVTFIRRAAIMYEMERRRRLIYLGKKMPTDSTA
jgi:hypothetical protein